MRTSWNLTNGRPAAVAALALLWLTACSDSDDPAGPGGDDPVDTTPPAAVTDLHTMSVAGDLVTLGWTAPGDDGLDGTATSYDLRFTAGPLGDTTWDEATACATEPDPAVAGTAQAAIVEMGGKSSVQFALKTVDDVGNWSALSNVASVPVADIFEVRRLTHDGNNVQPSLNDGYVVWVSTNTVTGDEIMIAGLENATPVPEVLTANGGEKANPDNRGRERIVWQGRAASAEDWEIWVYDVMAIPRYDALTGNEVPDKYPVLAGAGDIAWLQGHTMYESVMYWNENLHSLTCISDDCCPTTEWNSYSPTADDGVVIWQSYHRDGDQGARLRRWDGVVEDITDLITGGVGYQYSLHAGGLAYEAGGVIRYWDGAAVHEVGSGYNPSLHDSRVAFERWDGHDWEICYWDGTMVQQITDNDYSDMDPSLWGRRIAWIGRPPDGLNDVFYVFVP